MQASRLTRVLLCLLVLCMTVGLFAACNGNKTPENTTPTTPPDPNAGNQGDLPAEALEYLPDAKDFGNYEFRILMQVDYGEDILDHYESAAGMSGDAISQALYERDQYLSETFNFIFYYDTTSTAGNRAHNMVNKAYESGEDNWDIAYLLSGLTNCAPKGTVLNVLELDNLNLEASYWDQRSQEETVINGMLFNLPGDYTIYDELNSVCVFYNKSIYDEWNYENTYGTPYQMVSSGQWTYDNMLTMFKDTSTPKSGAALTKDDRWGMLVTYYGVNSFFLGSGQKTMANVDGVLTSLLDDATAFNQAYETISYILDTLFVNNHEALWSMNEAVLTDGMHATEMFREDKALFYFGAIIDGLALRDMESTFGILPVPTFFEGQTEYYCEIIYNAPMYFLTTCYQGGNIDTATAIAERLCYYSRYTPPHSTMSLYDAYYEKMTVAKLCRTGEDYQMLELIYRSKTYNIDTFSRIPNMSQAIVNGTELTYGYQNAYSMKVGFDTLYSNMSTLKKAVGQTLDSFLADVEKNKVVFD